MRFKTFSLFEWIFILSIMSLLVSPSVSALTNTNLTLESPADSGILATTSGLLNASLDSVIPAENWTTARYYAKSSSTANSSWVLIATISNDTGDFAFNGTFDTTILEDSNDYSFNVTLINGSDIIDKVTSSISIDNSVPIAPSGLTPTSSTSSTVAFSSTVKANATTSCLLIFTSSFPGSSGQYTMTHAGSTCTHSLTQVPNSIYDYVVQANDGTNYTNSSQQSVNVNVRGSSTGAIAQYVSEGGEVKTTSGKTITISDFIGGDGSSNNALLIGGLIVLIGGIVFYVNKK